MLYVLIPCLLMLVVAIILKKKEAAQSSDQADVKADKNKKNSNKKTSKKTATRATRSSTVTAPETVVAAAVTTKKIDKNLKQEIEQLIRSENYFAAEAKINQALNQDPSQHELYLYLLDVHLGQKDDFAMQQLIKYVRSLGLDTLADQAAQKSANAALLSHSSEAQAPTQTSSQRVNAQADSSAAFDALIDPSTTLSAANPTTAHTTKLAADSHQALEFSLAPQQATVPTDAVPSTEHNVVAFENSVQMETTPSSKSKVTPDSVKTEHQPLEFTLSTMSAPQLDSQAHLTVDVQPTENPAISEVAPSLAAAALVSDIRQHQSLEFNLQAEETQHTLPPDAKLEFHFNSTEQGSPEPSSATFAEKNDFKLNFDLALPTDTAPTIGTAHTPMEHAALAPVEALTFDLQTPLNLSPNELTFEPTLTAAPALAAQSPATAEHAHDPLAQAFPALLTVNEIQLNLDLATRYIELGAYHAAEQILNQNQADYSDQQRQYSEKLRNQIAS